MTDDRLLIAKDVAALLSVPESWVRQHTRSGELPHVQLGRYVRYRRADVIEWVDGLAEDNGKPSRKYKPIAPRDTT